MPTLTASRSAAMALSSSRIKPSARKTAQPLSCQRPLQDKQQPCTPALSTAATKNRSSTDCPVAKKVYKPTAVAPASSRRRAARTRLTLSPAPSDSSATTYRAALSCSPSASSSTSRDASPAAVEAAKRADLDAHLCNLETKRGSKVNLTIPQRLPPPPIEIVSSPYVDLAAHLRRHGLERDAQAVEDGTMPCEFLLSAYLEAGQLGKCSLHRQTVDFVPRLRCSIEAQATPNGKLAQAVQLDVGVDSCGSHLPPTHLLAVYDDIETASLVAAHAMVLALQCTSIPYLPPTEHDQPLSQTTLPIVPLCLPHPRDFEIVHKWLYHGDSTSLFQDLVPMAFVARFLSTLPSAVRSLRLRATPNPNPNPTSPSATVAEDIQMGATDRIAWALSHLATNTLLDSLRRIQAAWKNGVAVGILSSRYWNQLDKAWQTVVAALVLAKKRKASLAVTRIDQVTKELGSAAI
ncbi:hypothetical protein ACQY0O_001231 [Thecaphora frezii]